MVKIRVGPPSLSKSAGGGSEPRSAGHSGNGRPWNFVFEFTSGPQHLDPNAPTFTFEMEPSGNLKLVEFLEAPAKAVPSRIRDSEETEKVSEGQDKDHDEISTGKQNEREAEVLAEEEEMTNGISIKKKQRKKRGKKWRRRY